MENQQDPPDDASPTTRPQHRNKPRSYIDLSGKLYETIPPGMEPFQTLPAYTSRYTSESGDVQVVVGDEMTFIVRARTDTTDGTGGWPWSTIESIFTIPIPQQSTTTTEPDDTTTTSESSTKNSVIMPPISLLPHSPWWTQIDGTAQRSESTASSSSIRSSQSTTLSQTAESPDATTISTSSHNDLSSSSSDSSSIWSTTTSSAEWSWPTESSSPEPSTSGAEWAGVIVGAIFAFMIIILILISLVVRSRRKAPSRDNQNNINIRLDNGPFDHHHGPYNRPLAETNPGYVPEGWDDIRQ
ncbi:uncharacterized protein B0J16DRAFT_399765 [Fusarium flagelliforme]|uniref:Uncharacterized protein n=1 Tax=Fusarium flagelliforme TaxID=2675880 RepID=A0A395MVI5_9HYPO|nr:uncharacterized protein B0J16DRAFT_399765 [Fusarium flagelliforme]KAH7185916.1 hypothetical protein B0J16DRAFT_399765 [Fusarium flagelliforme]RFN51229.1 hypothetical protein FIE12Z_4547 [Fusarium flagelliforme]